MALAHCAALFRGILSKEWTEMDEKKLGELLAKVKSGDVPVDEAITQLKYMPFEDIGFAKIDHHRALRCGTPEVIYCAGKTPAQVRQIAERILAKGATMMATRAGAEHWDALRLLDESAEYHEVARIVLIRRGEPPTPRGGLILVVTAGTSDLPIAEEARVTAETLGNQVELLNDVGVAGIHRLFAYKDLLWKAQVIIVVAGMEGALPSVVSGLVSCPVIAVPTSVGYGANFGGIAPLLTMLNSCAAGVAVVNIDNGFGAGYISSMINRIGADKFKE